ncbi:MAG: hypothetical protein JSV73_01245 [Flavobacteriaceae bacterium]|nr:MAG: hypothetical protein JSV73_01245 [Flavobacteriaceae bacterium]
MKAKILISTIFLIFFCIACQTGNDEIYLEESSFTEVEEKEPIYMNIPIEERSFAIPMTGDDQLKSNVELRVVLGMAEYYTTGKSGQMGNTIIFGEKDRGNKQGYRDLYSEGPYGQNFHFSPVLAPELEPILPPGTTVGDESIIYYVDANRPPPGLGVNETNQAIRNAMNTWDGVSCSELQMSEIPYDGRPTGATAGLFGYPPSFDHFGSMDILFAGWIDGFDNLVPGGSEFIVGVTFTWFWGFQNADGEWTSFDANNDGFYDVIIREIYFNEDLGWSTDGTANMQDMYDVQTVALHESGHGLSQAHFGKGFINKGGMHFAPRAVMNAAYSEIQREIGKTDNAGHCSLWGNWPNYSQRPTE